MPVAGALAVTAFAPLGWFPVACLALMPLFYCWQQDTPVQALRHGLLFGLGFFGAGIIVARLVYRASSRGEVGHE